MPDTGHALEEQEQERLVIDHNFRNIEAITGKLFIGVLNDIDVHKIPFRCPRYYGEVDLSEFTFRINYLNAAGLFYYYEVDPNAVTVSSTGDAAVIDFDWLVGKDACSYAGDVPFNVFAYHEDEGVIDKAYHTIIYTGYVAEGLESPVAESD